MSEQKVIDLGPHTDDGKVKNLAGKEKGLDVRRAEGLDELDRIEQPVRIVVPEFVDAISPSFFLGMFSKSISYLGSKDSFLRHYSFECTEVIYPQILEGVEDYFRARNSIDELLSRH